MSVSRKLYLKIKIKQFVQYSLIVLNRTMLKNDSYANKKRFAFPSVICCTITLTGIPDVLPCVMVAQCNKTADISAHIMPAIL